MWKYVLFLIAIHTVGRLPLRVGYVIASMVGRLAYVLSPNSRRNVISNLRHVMGENTPVKNVHAAARAVFTNIAMYYVDLVRMPHMDLEHFFRHRLRDYGFDEYLLPAVATGQGVIVLSCHLGNPELAVQGMLPRGVATFALTEPLQPPRLHRLVDSLRASKGNSFAPVSFAGVRRAIQILRQGGVVALMGDRDIEGPRARLQFFGEEAMMPTGPIEVAMRTGAVVIPSFCLRNRHNGIDAHLEEPLELERTGDVEKDIRTNTLLFLGRMERRLREHPDQWAVLESIWDEAPDPPEPEPAALGKGVE
jgi:KDO2-lipid IV(A) lauroyltransferase